MLDSADSCSDPGTTTPGDDDAGTTPAGTRRSDGRTEHHPGRGRDPRPITLHGLGGLQERAGQEIGTSGWRTVAQADIDTFATLTGDEQWIHTDPERARGGPFGTTVQHGFLTLGLATGLLWEVATVDGFGVVLNYGLNRVRFPAPLRVGSRIRMHVAIAEVRALDGGAEAVYRLTYEVEGEPRPCCVADLVFRYYA